MPCGGRLSGRECLREAGLQQGNGDPKRRIWGTGMKAAMDAAVYSPFQRTGRCGSLSAAVAHAALPWTCLKPSMTGIMNYDMICPVDPAGADFPNAKGENERTGTGSAPCGEKARSGTRRRP